MKPGKWNQSPMETAIKIGGEKSREKEIGQSLYEREGKILFMSQIDFYVATFFAFFLLVTSQPINRHHLLCAFGRKNEGGNFSSLCDQDTLGCQEPVILTAVSTDRKSFQEVIGEGASWPIKWEKRSCSHTD